MGTMTAVDARLRVLVLEDSEADLAIIKRELRFLEEAEVKRARTLGEALQSIEGRDYDLCILDLNVPDSRGIDTFRRIFGEAVDVPVVVLTGLDDVALGTQAVREGAQDFVIKGESVPGRLGTTVRFAVERQRLVNELRAKTEELERSNEDLENFAYVASHDLQEPLRMVSGYCGLIKRRYAGRLDSDADEFIEFAVDGANRMSRMIRELLNFSRAGSRETVFQDCPVASALDIAFANLDTSLSGAGAVVTSGELPQVYANQGQLVQVFQNLIGNALKFRGSEAPRIHVDAARCDSEGADLWEISVTDNGVGVDPAYSERVFEMFHLLDRKTEGCGIGLSICRKIVKRHGGRIWLEPADGGGSVFRFTLPPARVDATGDKDLAATV